jgi:hypothetical protein
VLCQKKQQLPVWGETMDPEGLLLSGGKWHAFLKRKLNSRLSMSFLIWQDKVRSAVELLLIIRFKLSIEPGFGTVSANDLV